MRSYRGNAVMDVNQSASAFPRGAEYGPVIKALNAYCKRKQLTPFRTHRAKGDERRFCLWEKVRAGKITDPRTLAAMAKDTELQAAFARFDQEAKIFLPGRMGCLPQTASAGAPLARKTKTNRCKGCGFAISPGSDYCGECMCEEESL